MRSAKFHFDHDVQLGGIQLTGEMVEEVSRVSDASKQYGVLAEIRELGQNSLTWEVVNELVDEALGVRKEEDDEETTPQDDKPDEEETDYKNPEKFREIVQKVLANWSSWKEGLGEKQFKQIIMEELKK